MPTLALSMPFIIIGIIAALLIDDPQTRAYSVAACIVPLVFAYIFRPQIEWWWFTRNPPKLHKKMRGVLDRFFPMFSKLSQENRLRFENRMALYMLSKSYEKKVIDVVPEDLKGLIAANAIQLTFGLEEYLSPKFETIVLYPSQFPSPTIPKFHASEVFKDGDFGGLIFALDHIIPGLRDSQRYNIVMHEFVNLLWIQNEWSEKAFLEHATPRNLLLLAKIRGMSLAQVQKYLGKPTINFFAVAIEHFFAKPESFKKLLPDLYKTISKQLNQDPLEESNPVIIALEIEEKTS